MGTANRRFRHPIFIIAPPRSGTTLLYEALSQSPELWNIGGESHGIFEGIESLRPVNRGWVSNRLASEDATPEVVNRITSAFFARLRDRNGLRPPGYAMGLRLLEKTPRNCLRVPFVAAAFPDGRFLYVFREPLETISSMLDAWRSGRYVSYPALPEWQGLLPWSLLLIPGWRDLAAKEVAEIAARQWAVATSCLLDDLEALGPERWDVASYHRLVDEPQAEVLRLSEAFGFAWDRDLRAPLPSSSSILTPPESGKWRRNAEELDRVMPLIDRVVERARSVAARAQGPVSA